MDFPGRVRSFEGLLSRSEQVLKEARGDGRERTRDALKELAVAGIPDNPPYIRPAAYQFLLNLPSTSTALDQYSAFVEEISNRTTALPLPQDGVPIKADRLLQEIHRDVERTFGNLAWFSTLLEGGEGTEDPLWTRIRLLDELDEARGSSLAGVSSSDSEPPAPPATPPPTLSVIPPAESGEGARAASVPVTPTTPTSHLPSTSSTRPRPHTRRQSLLRPLFIYATLNPGISYVQGMHQIVAVLVWIFSSAHPPPLQAEANAFFALGAILSQLQDLYMQSLDGAVSPPPTSPPATTQYDSLNQSTPVGLGATLSRFTSLLSWLDPNVASSLEKKGLDPALYVFKWLTTLFVSEFQLPDLVRIWDRIFALFPSETDQGNGEVSSPVLGHLIDLSLAMVLLERARLVSPFVDFEKCILMLQNAQIEGEVVDRLLASAWEIRTQRLGKTQLRVASNGVGANDWRTAASKWSSVAAVSTASTATSLGRWWSSAAPPAPPRSSIKSLAGEYDLDDSASVAESDISVATAPPTFASRNQQYSAPIGGRRVRSSTISEFATVAGKILPPPPEEIDERESLASLMQTTLPLPPSMIDLNDAEDDHDGESEAGEDSGDEKQTLRAQAANSWGGLKASFSKLASSDRAAALSKATTNLSIQAQMLREQGPERLAKIRENVTAASGRFIPSSSSILTPASIRRSGSPVSEGFVPPSLTDLSSGGSHRPVSPLPNDTFSPSPSGPKPLLLSGSARRAMNASQDTISPPDSRRNSASWRSPSPTASANRPLFSPDGPLTGGSTKRYSNTPLTPRVLASTFHSRAMSAASPSPGALGLEVSEDSPIQSRRLRSSSNLGEGKDLPPITNGRLRRSLRREGEESEQAMPTIASSPVVAGRKWSLSDSPVVPANPEPEAAVSLNSSNNHRTRPAPLDLAFITDHAESLHQVAIATPATAKARPETPPPRALPGLPSAAGNIALPLSPESPMRRGGNDRRTRSIHDFDFPATSTSRPSSTSTSEISRPPRSSSISSDINILSPATSTTDPIVTTRSSKIVRRAPVSSSGKRISRSVTGSISSLNQDDRPVSSPISPSTPTSSSGSALGVGTRERRSITAAKEKRKSVSSFLVGETGSGSAGSGEETKRQISLKRRSRGKELLDQPGMRESVGDWDQILSAYGTNEE